MQVCPPKPQDLITTTDWSLSGKIEDSRIQYNGASNNLL